MANRNYYCRCVICHTVLCVYIDAIGRIYTAITYTHTHTQTHTHHIDNSSKLLTRRSIYHDASRSSPFISLLSCRSLSCIITVCGLFYRPYIHLRTPPAPHHRYRINVSTDLVLTKTKSRVSIESIIIIICRKIIIFSVHVLFLVFSVGRAFVLGFYKWRPGILWPRKNIGRALWRDSAGIEKPLI